LNHPLVQITASGFLALFCLFFASAKVCPAKAATTPDVTTHIASDPDFPIYPSIKPNVEFWIDIFTKYSKSQGVMHDTHHLGVVYEIVDLDPSRTARADRRNKRTKKAVTKVYQSILLKLAAGAPAVSKEEKRVAALLGPKAKPSDFKNAAFRIRCQTGLKDEFQDGLIRSGAVIDAFRKTFRSHGLPVDLVYLPCVESSYNFKAYSKFGAAGIWQFTHGTGRQYMNINYVVDERRDPYISTDAAARLLKKNYAALGEWPLAMTAYNHGLAGMMRAQKAKGSYENIVRSYRSRSFKFASRNFYSEFLAARIVAKNPEKYFGPMEFHKPAVFQTIKIKGYLPVKDLSDQLQVSIPDIKALNPSLRSPVFNGQKYIPKGFILRLPQSTSIPEARKNLAGLYHDRQNPSRFHRVQKGDTAGSIARTNSVRLQDLILANGLNRRATIYIGQNLRIPVKDEIILAQKESHTDQSGPVKSKETAVKKSVVKNITQAKKLSKSPPEPIDPSSVAASAKLPEPDKPKPIIEPATSIKPVEKTEPAGKKTEPAEQIVSAPAPETNGMEANALPAEPIKDETPVNVHIVTSDLKVLETHLEGKNLVGTIKVEAEETLGHYADWLGIPTQKIRTLNRFKYGTPISIDQTIKIPLNKTSVQKFEEQRYEFHKEIEEDFFESFAAQEVDTYVVKNGDTIWSLCLSELEIPFWLLKKYNPGIKFSALFAGQRLNSPVIVSQKMD
jgi:membrane-bound lytic murein transglycosylase D